MTGLVSRLVSVRGRITVAVTVLFGLAVTLGGWFLLGQAESAWIDDLEAADLAELEMLAQDLQAFDAMVGEEIFLPVGVDGTSFQLVDGSGELVGQTPQGLFGGVVVVEQPLAADQIPPAFLDGAVDVVSITPLAPATNVSLPVELASGSLTLIASSSLEPVHAGVSALRGILWIIGPLLVTGVGAASWLVTGRAFRPVADITNQVERITDDRLSERVPVPDSRDEVAHLAVTMNNMLDRLSTSRTRQREFVSDASHELRSPVAASKTKLEVALAHPERADWEDTARVVLAEQERLGGLVDDMLLLARLDEGKAVVADEVDLDDIVFGEAARPYDVNVDVSAVTAVRVRGDARQLSRLTRNLVANATRHARQRVAISLSVAEGEAVLAVADDGPGICSEDRERIFERFVRLDDSRVRDEGGAGLGLALVNAVVAVHGGSVTVAEADLGGALFEVRLPIV